MNPLSLIFTLIEELGEAAEDAAGWAQIAAFLKQFGSAAGLSLEIIEAAENSSNFVQFFGKLEASIAGGDVGAAAAVVIAGIALNLSVAGIGVASPTLALSIVGGIAALPEIVTISATATVMTVGYTIGSAEGVKLFNAAYSNLIQAFQNINAPAPATWTEIGDDSSGNSLLLDALNNASLSTALGLSADSTMIVDMASAGTQTSANADDATIAESSLLNDANFLGAAVAANEIGGNQAGVLSGNAVTAALSDILVQFAGDQAAAAAASPLGVLPFPHQDGDFANSTNSVLSIDLNPNDWSATYAQASPVIVGEQELLDAVATNILGPGASTAFADNYLFDNNPSLIEAALTSGAALSDSQAGTSYASSTANAVLIGQNDTTIDAGDGNDLIIGGQNVTAGNGNNIIVGTSGGGETISIGDGSNVIYAPGVNNTLNVPAPLGAGINVIYAGSGGCVVNMLTSNDNFEVFVSDFSEQNVINLNPIAFENAVFSNNYYSSDINPAWAQLPWTFILVPVEENYGPDNSINGTIPYSNGETFSYTFASTVPSEIGGGVIDLADCQQADLNPLPQQTSPTQPTQPQQPVDPGPTPGVVADTLNVGQSVDLTSAILAAATPGLPGDFLAIDGIDATGAIGTVSFANGDVTYDASTADFSLLAANASETDSFTYTLIDQLGDVATGVVNLTIDNPVAITAPNVTVNISDDNETINMSGSGDTTTLYGKNNNVTATGSRETLNAAGTGEAISISSGTVNLWDDASASVTGSDDALALNAGNALVATGDGDTAIVNATGNTLSMSDGSLALYNNSEVALTGDDDAMTMYNNVSFTETGTANTIVSGSGDTIAANGSDDVVNLDGTGDSVSISSGTVNLWNGAAGAVAGSDDSLALNADNTLVATGGDDSAIVNATGNTLSMNGGSLALYNNSELSLAGNNDAVTTYNNVSLTATGGSLAVSVDGTGDSLNLGSASVTIANGDKATITGNDNSIALSSNNTIAAVGANETYTLSPNSGASEISASPGANTGTVQFGAGVSDQNLWFVQSGNNLQIDVLGTSSQLTVADWFGGPNAAAVQTISADGLRIDKQLGLLVQAMATFGVENPAFNPATATQLPNDQNLQTVIAAAWHG